MAISSHQHQPPGNDESRWLLDRRWTSRGRVLESTSSRTSEVDAEDSSLSWVTYSGDAPKREGLQSVPGSPHLWPTDEYAYNGLTEPTQRYRVRDLMLAMWIELHSGRGEMAWSLSDGAQTFEVRLAAGERELRLFVDGQEDSGQRVKLSGSMWKRRRLVEMSLFDRQLLFALDGEVIFQRPLEPLALPVKNGNDTAKDSDSGEPVKFGVRDLHASVSDLTLFRDVYYTRGDGRHGIAEPYQLGPDEYFFLGDNSPVSLDSRSWAAEIVRDNMLIGKPFLVHLPSRPGRIKLGSAEWHIRVPDWGRIRYIR
jgi:Signal peptidase, peptidase S26